MHPPRAPARSKLLVHLPRKVDADRGRARWDGAKRVLTVTARIAPDDAFA